MFAHPIATTRTNGATYVAMGGDHALDRLASSASIGGMARTTLNFEEALTDEQVEALTHSNDRSIWVDALRELNVAVDAGKVAHGKFILIGTFGNATGARTAARNLEKRGDNLPGVFDLRSVIVAASGEEGSKRTSKLYAAVVAPSENGESDTPTTTGAEVTPTADSAVVVPEAEPESTSRRGRGRS